MVRRPDTNQRDTALPIRSHAPCLTRDDTGAARAVQQESPSKDVPGRPDALARLAAMNLGRTQTALGAFYRRVAFRIGKAKAITATARTLAVLVYRTLKDHLAYVDPGADAYDARTALASSVASADAPSILDSDWSTSRPAK